MPLSRILECVEPDMKCVANNYPQALQILEEIQVATDEFLSVVLLIIETCK